jgi:hypothetical protein
MLVVGVDGFETARVAIEGGLLAVVAWFLRSYASSVKEQFSKTNASIENLSSEVRLWSMELIKMRFYMLETFPTKGECRDHREMLDSRLSRIEEG